MSRVLKNEHQPGKFRLQHSEVLSKQPAHRVLQLVRARQFPTTSLYLQPVVQQSIQPDGQIPITKAIQNRSPSHHQVLSQAETGLNTAVTLDVLVSRVRAFNQDVLKELGLPPRSEQFQAILAESTVEISRFIFQFLPELNPLNLLFAVDLSCITYMVAHCIDKQYSVLSTQLHTVIQQIDTENTMLDVEELIAQTLADVCELIVFQVTGLSDIDITHLDAAAALHRVTANEPPRLRLRQVEKSDQRQQVNWWPFVLEELTSVRPNKKLFDQVLRTARTVLLSRIAGQTETQNYSLQHEPNIPATVNTPVEEEMTKLDTDTQYLLGTMAHAFPHLIHDLPYSAPFTTSKQKPVEENTTQSQHDNTATYEVELNFEDLDYVGQPTKKPQLHKSYSDRKEPVEERRPSYFAQLSEKELEQIAELDPNFKVRWDNKKLLDQYCLAMQIDITSTEIEDLIRDVIHSHSQLMSETQVATQMTMALIRLVWEKLKSKVVSRKNLINFKQNSEDVSSVVILKLTQLRIRLLPGSKIKEETYTDFELRIWPNMVQVLNGGAVSEELIGYLKMMFSRELISRFMRGKHSEEINLSDLQPNEVPSTDLEEIILRDKGRDMGLSKADHEEIDTYFKQLEVYILQLNNDLQQQIILGLYFRRVRYEEMAQLITKHTNNEIKVQTIKTRLHRALIDLSVLIEMHNQVFLDRMVALDIIPDMRSKAEYQKRKLFYLRTVDRGAAKNAKFKKN